MVGQTRDNRTRIYLLAVCKAKMMAYILRLSGETVPKTALEEDPENPRFKRHRKKIKTNWDAVVFNLEARNRTQQVHNTQRRVPLGKTVQNNTFCEVVKRPEEGFYSP